MAEDHAKQQQIPTYTRRLVARHKGTSFREVAHVVEAPLPALQEGQVLVRMTHLGINGGCETFRARCEHACAPNFSFPPPNPNATAK